MCWCVLWIEREMLGTLTLREGLLPVAGTLSLRACCFLATTSAGVTGDGSAKTWTALTTFLVAVDFPSSPFSCELAGSAASLLGTGVTMADAPPPRRVTLIELDFVVSFRHGEESTLAAADDDVADAALPDDLEK